MTTSNTSVNKLTVVSNEIDEWQDFELELDNRKTKGTSEFIVPQLKGWISIGKPHVRHLPESDDSELSDFEFYHVLLAASFRPEDGALFDRVWVQVKLETKPDGEAIAWSMHPHEEFTQIDIKRTVGINAKAGLEWVSSEGKTETERSWIGQEAHLVALNEMCSDPVWEFISTEQVPIMGSQRLHLVVRSKSSLSVNGVVSVTATVKHKRFGIFTCKSKAVDTPSLTFDIN